MEEPGPLCRRPPQPRLLGGHCIPTGNSAFLQAAAFASLHVPILPLKSCWQEVVGCRTALLPLTGAGQLDPQSVYLWSQGLGLTMVGDMLRVSSCDFSFLERKRSGSVRSVSDHLSRKRATRHQAFHRPLLQPHVPAPSLIFSENAFSSLSGGITGHCSISERDRAMATSRSSDGASGLLAFPLFCGFLLVVPFRLKPPTWLLKLKGSHREGSVVPPILGFFYHTEPGDSVRLTATVDSCFRPHCAGSISCGLI